ncbi:hypothetical protein V8C35DRAFT_266453 [Trichoderma chlorosporum]
MPAAARIRCLWLLAPATLLRVGTRTLALLPSWQNPSKLRWSRLYRPHLLRNERLLVFRSGLRTGPRHELRLPLTAGKPWVFYSFSSFCQTPLSLSSRVYISSGPVYSLVFPCPMLRAPERQCGKCQVVSQWAQGWSKTLCSVGYCLQFTRLLCFFGPS